MPSPMMFTDPKLRLDPDSSAVDLECFVNSLSDAVSQDSEEWETFCGTGTSYGPARRTISVTVLVSYGADGSWTQLQAFAGTETTFELTPDGMAAVSVDNPVMSGSVRVPEIPFVGSTSPGSVGTYDLELSVEGEAVFVTAAA